MENASTYNGAKNDEVIISLKKNNGKAEITVHVRKLREKIEYDPSNPQYIETVWGEGYRFKI